MNFVITETVITDALTEIRNCANHGKYISTGVFFIQSLLKGKKLSQLQDIYPSRHDGADKKIAEICLKVVTELESVYYKDAMNAHINGNGGYFSKSDTERDMIVVFPYYTKLSISQRRVLCEEIIHRTKNIMNEMIFSD